MNVFIYQLKQAWAGLSKKPGFVATVLTTMGVTMGALLCVLTLGYLLLLQPLPYPEQDQLYRVNHTIIDQEQKPNAQAFTYPGLVHLYQNQTIFDQAAMINYQEDVLLSHPLQPALKIAFVTPEWFDMLGAKMALGRAFEDTEAFDASNPVAVLSYQAWQSQFGGDTAIIGKKVNFTDVSYQVIGVVAKSFIEPQVYQTGNETGVWLPWDFNYYTENRRQNFGGIDQALNLVGKLNKALTVQNAEQVVTPLVSDRWVEGVTGVDFFKGWQVKMSLSSFKTVILGDIQRTIYMLLAGVIGLVMIATANIVNLFMSRTAEQQRQMAIHAAVGAKKSDLFRALFAEAGLLMFFSIVIALVIAVGGFFIMQQYLAEVLPRVNELTLNHITLVSAILIVFIFAFVFSRLSAGMVNYRAINASLQSSGKGSGIQVSKRIRQVLIASQVAIVTSLVFVNISLFDDAAQTINTPMGIEVDNVVALELSFSSVASLNAQERGALITEAAKQFEQLPQVEAVNIGGTPLNGFGIWAMTQVESNKRYTPRGHMIDAGYFEMLSQPLLEGQYFSKADIVDRNNVMIINDVLAKELAPDGSALGLHFSMGGDNNMKIIGVVKSFLLPGASATVGTVYVPTFPGNSSLMLKVKDGQEISRELAIDTLKQSTNRMTIFALQRQSDRHAYLLFTQYTTAVTTTVLTLLSFFLAAIGLYGIFSYSTQLRRFELGTRLAIGAKRKDLVALILRDNSSPIFIGIGVSLLMLLALYLGFAEQLESYLSGGLVVIYIATLILVSAVSIWACYWPLRRIINRPAIHSLRQSD